MTIGLLIALGVVNLAWMVLLERKDRRHDSQVTRLLMHVQVPKEAAMQAMMQPQVPAPEFHSEFTEQTEHLQDLAPFIGAD